MPPTVTRQTTRPTVNHQRTSTATGALARIHALTEDHGGLKFSTYGRTKCLGRGTPVLMFDGTIKAVEYVEEGECLMGPDSLPRMVTELSSGVGPLYRITPTKGDPWVCNDKHVLTLIGNITKIKNVIRDIPLVDYIAEQNEGVQYCNNWQLLRCSVDFSSKFVPEVPPYLLGLWMGDGGRQNLSITNSNPVICEYCQGVAIDMGLKCNVRSDRNTYSIEFSAGKGDGVWFGKPGRNPLRTFFKKCTVGTLKKIPIEYLTSARKWRMELLAGIIDTDARNTGNSCSSVTVTGELYKDDLLFLCRSLGFAAYCGKVDTHVCANGRVSSYYSITISGDLDTLPTKVKKFLPRRQPKRVLVTGFEVEDIGEGEYFGFTLDRDGRFLLGDFTITHNTGKTRLACSFPKPLLLIGTEKGTKSLKSITGIDFVDIQAGADMEQFTEHLKEGKYKSVVLDTGGGFQSIVLKEVLGLADMPINRTYGMATRDDWTACGAQTIKYLIPLLNLSDSHKLNVVVIAHERNYNEEAKGDVMMPSVGPAMTPMVANWLNGVCDYIGQMYIREVEETITKKNQQGKEIEVRTGKTLKEYCLRIGAHAIFTTGFRSPHAIPDSIVDPTYEKILKVINGQKV